jgi:hypothetical protein
MLYRILQMAWACTIGWISNRLAAKENEQAIKVDQTSLDQKTVEAKQTLDDLDKLGALKTEAATGVKQAEAKVADDDVAVTAAAEKVKEVESIQIKPQTGVTGAQLDEKFKDL